MEEMIQGLMTKVGLDKEKAEQVVAFIRENATKVPQWLASNETARGVLDKLPGGLGDKLGGMFGGGNKT
jgi:hypothetical protein